MTHSHTEFPNTNASLRNLTRYSPFEIGSCDVLCFSLLRRTTTSYSYFDSSYLTKEKIITNDPFLRSLQMAYSSRFQPIFFFICHSGIMGLRKMTNRKMISNSAYPRLFLKATMTTAIILLIINLGPTTLPFLLPMNNTAATQVVARVINFGTTTFWPDHVS